METRDRHDQEPCKDAAAGCTCQDDNDPQNGPNRTAVCALTSSEMMEEDLLWAGDGADGSQSGPDDCVWRPADCYLSKSQLTHLFVNSSVPSTAFSRRTTPQT